MVGTLRFAHPTDFATTESSSCRGLRPGGSLVASPSRSVDARTMTLLPIPANPAPEGGTNALPQTMGNARFKPS